MSNYELFTSLHKRGNPLLLGNAWNVPTAKLFEKNGYRAIGTSSLAIANSLGYEDGEKIPFDQLFIVVERILAHITVPLSVDMEAGYGPGIGDILKNLEKIHDAGVVGINLEDSEQGQLLPKDHFSKKLLTIKNHLVKNNRKIFINARTDAYLLNDASALETTLERVRAYENAGADGIFVPFIKEKDDIVNITETTTLPLNVLSMPGLASFDSLTQWGVSRISLGSTAFRATYRNFENLIKTVVTEKSTSALFK